MKNFLLAASLLLTTTAAAPSYQHGGRPAGGFTVSR